MQVSHKLQAPAQATTPARPAPVLIARREAATAQAIRIIVDRNKFAFLSDKKPAGEPSDLELLESYINGEETQLGLPAQVLKRRLNKLRTQLRTAKIPDDNEIEFLVNGLIDGHFISKAVSGTVSLAKPLHIHEAELLLLQASGYNAAQIETLEMEDTRANIKTDGDKKNVLKEKQIRSILVDLRKKLGAANPIKAVLNALALNLIDLDLIRSKRLEVEDLDKARRVHFNLHTAASRIKIPGAHHPVKKPEAPHWLRVVAKWTK